MRTLWLVLRGRRDLRFLLLAALVSMTGDRMLGIGLSYQVYAVTGSTLTSAGVLLASFLPSLLLGSYAGVLVDRWDRRRTMVLVNLALGAALIPLAFVDLRSQIGIVYAAAAVEGTLRLLFVPAEQAMLPRVVPDDDLVVANALNGQAREVARLVGAASGGVVVTLGGLPLLVGLDIATYALAAWLVTRIRTSGAVAAEGARLPWWRDLGVGLGCVRRRVELQVVFAVALVVNTGEGIMATLFAPFVRDVLGGSGAVYGTIAATQAVGGLLGGVLTAAMAQRVSAVGLFGVGALLFGLIDGTMFVYPLVAPVVWPALVCMAVVGLPVAAFSAGFTTVLQRATNDATRGRVLGALAGVQGLGILVGALGAGLLGERVHLVLLLSVHALGTFAAGLLVLGVLSRQPAPAHQPESDLRSA